MRIYCHWQTDKNWLSLPDPAVATCQTSWRRWRCWRRSWRARSGRRSTWRRRWRPCERRTYGYKRNLKLRLSSWRSSPTGSSRPSITPKVLLPHPVAFHMYQLELCRPDRNLPTFWSMWKTASSDRMWQHTLMSFRHLCSQKAILSTRNENYIFTKLLLLLFRTYSCASPFPDSIHFLPEIIMFNFSNLWETHFICIFLLRSNLWIRKNLRKNNNFCFQMAFKDFSLKNTYIETLMMMTALLDLFIESDQKIT